MHGYLFQDAELDFARSARAIAPSVSIVLIDPRKVTQPRILMPGFVVVHSSGVAVLTSAVSMVMGQRIRSAAAGA